MLIGDDPLPEAEMYETGGKKGATHHFLIGLGRKEKLTDSFRFPWAQEPTKDHTLTIGKCGAGGEENIDI